MITEPRATVLIATRVFVLDFELSQMPARPLFSTMPWFFFSYTKASTTTDTLPEALPDNDKVNCSINLSVNF